jgi:xylosylprotein 4-beta-galactosyltransferase
MAFESPRNFTDKKLAIVVPFRDAHQELEIFAPYMTSFLNAQQVPFHIFIVNQKDEWRFNRGALINVGYLYSKDKFDYLAQHDIDYLPLNPKLSYKHPGDAVLHMVPYYLRPGNRPMIVRISS